MTAEIAVMNRNAVALAADSAVTLQLPEGPKIYYTNKLFALSKYQPVGVMIYGSADFMGLPWETIIKRYRAQLGNRSFARLQNYGDDFLRHIEQQRDLRASDLQTQYIHQFAHSWLHKFKIRLRAILKRRAESGTVITDSLVKATARALFEVLLEISRRSKPLPRFSGVRSANIASRYQAAIRAAIQRELQNFPRFASLSSLERTIALALTKRDQWSQESGIVIAGFGRMQSLPSLRAYVLDGMVANRLRVEPTHKDSDISHDNTAIVSAFAQGEMAALFMNGIDREFEDYLLGFVAKTFSDGYPEALKRLLQKRLKVSALTKTVKELKDIGSKLSAELETAAHEYSRQMHWEPIIQIVKHLPKEELAAMAEALVNLTSFKRHVSRQADTVGGPIDVAVISRGDGLVWIKRRHYFRPELNRHFLSNYYNDCKEARTPYEKAARFL